MNKNKESIGVIDILCEFIEVIIHNVLYIRKLYPDSIFVRKKKYGVPVHQVIQPDVQNYINHCLKAIAFHCRNKKLQRLFICFQNTDIVIDQFVFDVLEILELDDSDPYLIELEQSFRDFMLKLYSIQVYLEPLTSDESTFSIRLQTTLSSSVEFNENPQFEEFSWITDHSIGRPENDLCIIPIHTVQNSYLKLQTYIEK